MIDDATFTELLKDRFWRLNNLYYITNKRGFKIKFKLNFVQEKLYENLWYCNIILKARQLGVSTFVSLLFLDATLFTSHTSAGIICHTREDAEILFRKIKFAYDNLLPEIKQKITARTDTARELSFSNGSSIRVGTSMRGQTLQYLHISEFGKICSKYRDKAEEIISGSLNTLAPGQYVFIESTAEGKEGYFYDMCQIAKANADAKKELTLLDYKFHFFPWWLDPVYRIGSPITLTENALDYFKSLESRGVKLDAEQKYWYAQVSYHQQDLMMREFPSTPEEAWESSNEGIFYAKQVIQARLENRIGHVPYEDRLDVHVSIDLGIADSTAIIFFQIFQKEIRIIDYLEGSGESLQHWIGEIKKKPYCFGKFLAPHDIMVKEFTSGISRQSTARNMGINFIPVPRHEIIPGIDAVRSNFTRFWIDKTKCERLIKCLENYRKEWDERYGVWRSAPRHDEYSHGCDALRYLCAGLPIVCNTSTTDAKTLGYGSITARRF